MPLRPSYKVCRGDHLDGVEVVQPDGGRALVVGRLDAVPLVAGGCVLPIVASDAHIAGAARGAARPSSSSCGGGTRRGSEGSART